MILDDLRSVILERRRTPRPDSYITSLLSKGKDEVLKKIGEEAIEVIVASKGGDRAGIIHELADLWFHCMVLMNEEGISHEDIFRELENRSAKRRETDD
jgi:phosphoribosyl-ATP pyrophosphohydrolase